MNREEAKQKFLENGIEMKYIDVDIIGSGIVENYIDEYGDYKIGDKLKINKKKFMKGIRGEDDEMKEIYMTLFDREELIIEYFYNIGAVAIKDFGYGMELDWFDKVS